MIGKTWIFMDLVFLCCEVKTVVVMNEKLMLGYSV